MLSERELDISFDQGLLEGVLVNAPVAVKDALTNVINGIAYYRQKLDTLQEDYTTLQANYNNLTALTAGYLQVISELRQQNEQLLIETQRDLHHQE